MSAYSAALEAYVDGFVTDITATDATIDWIRPRAWIAGRASSAAEAEVAVNLIRSRIRERAPKLWRTKHRDAVIKGLQRMLAALRGPSLLPDVAATASGSPPSRGAIRPPTPVPASTAYLSSPVRRSTPPAAASRSVGDSSAVAVYLSTSGAPRTHVPLGARSGGASPALATAAALVTTRRRPRKLHGIPESSPAVAHAAAATSSTTLAGAFAATAASDDDAPFIVSSTGAPSPSAMPLSLARLTLKPTIEELLLAASHAASNSAATRCALGIPEDVTPPDIIGVAGAEFTVLQATGARLAQALSDLRELQDTCDATAARLRLEVLRTARLARERDATYALLAEVAAPCSRSLTFSVALFRKLQHFRLSREYERAQAERAAAQLAAAGGIPFILPTAERRAQEQAAREALDREADALVAHAS